MRDPQHRLFGAFEPHAATAFLIGSEPMRIPIPEVVVPVVVLLLFRFVPGLKERPWTVVCDVSPSGPDVGRIFVGQNGEDHPVSTS